LCLSTFLPNCRAGTGLPGGRTVRGRGGVAYGCTVGAYVVRNDGAQDTPYQYSQARMRPPSLTTKNTFGCRQLNTIFGVGDIGRGTGVLVRSGGRSGGSGLRGTQLWDVGYSLPNLRPECVALR